jgi:hypothetical protein
MGEVGSPTVKPVERRGMRSNRLFDTDAQARPLPSVAPGFVRRLPLR